MYVGSIWILFPVFLFLWFEFWRNHSRRSINVIVYFIPLWILKKELRYKTLTSTLCVCVCLETYRTGRTSMCRGWGTWHQCVYHLLSQILGSGQFSWIWTEWVPGVCPVKKEPQFLPIYTQLFMSRSAILYSTGDTVIR